MITRELKLKLTQDQERTLNSWLWYLTGVYNWAIRKIELDAQIKIYYSEKKFYNLLANHSKKLEIPSHAIQGILCQAWNAWQRCFRKIGGKPKFKSVRNKLNSIPLPDSFDRKINCNRVRIPELGRVKFHKQSLPLGRIKCGRILKRASGWYLSLVIDTIHKFDIQATDKKIGIDTGFKDLAVLSDGTKIENNRYFVKSQKRLAQAQRGHRRYLTSRLHEKIANQRKDYNHKISRKIVENYQEIYITKDSMKGIAAKFGKSVGDAGISQLRSFISYKGDIHGRKVKFVDSHNITLTCSACGSLTGPTGLVGLKVRDWECKVCGKHHDRDVNAAVNILNLGLGTSLEKTHPQMSPVDEVTNQKFYKGM